MKPTTIIAISIAGSIVVGALLKKFAPASVRAHL